MMKNPKKLKEINSKDDVFEKTKKYIFNAICRENGQRNYIENGLVEAENEDIILISDVDEIPDLSKINFNKLDEKIIIFEQNMFYYKFLTYIA